MIRLAPEDYVLALDISTSLGIAEGWADSYSPRLTVEQFSETDDDSNYERAMARALVWAGRRLAASSPLPRPTVVVIEGSQTNGFGGKTTFNTTRMLLGLLGVITAAVRAKEIRIVSPAVSTIRAVFIGHGRLAGPVAKKQVQAMCRLLDWEAPDHNAADAAAAWAWFVTRDPIGTRLALRHREALKGLSSDAGQGQGSGGRGRGRIRR